MIRIKKRSFFEIFFPIALIAFIGQGGGIVEQIINGNTRWIFFFVLFFYLLLNKKFLRGIQPLLLLVLISYLVWCILTTLWSQVPFLSFMKSTMFFLCTTTFLSGGYLWAMKYSYSRNLNCLCWIVMTGLLAGTFGRGSSNSIDIDQGLALYQGLTGSANMFGSLMAMSFPVLLWRLYQHWKAPKKRLAWGTLLALCISFLIVSFSRSALLAVLMTLFIFILHLDFRKKMKIFTLCALALLLSMSLMASSITSFMLAHVYKSTAHTGLLDSRQSPWQISYEQAVKGGWTGGGFGATIGETQYTFSGLSAGYNYGREKANSQLAIIEETGIIGFCFYIALLFLFFSKAFYVIQKIKGPEKVVLSIILGSLLGILTESVFEAWWDAPAAPESVYFWTLFGLALGIMKKSKKGLKYEHTPMEAPNRKLISHS